MSLKLRLFAISLAPPNAHFQREVDGHIFVGKNSETMTGEIFLFS
jgi:hypothetical protein